MDSPQVLPAARGGPKGHLPLLLLQPGPCRPAAQPGQLWRLHTFVLVLIPKCEGCAWCFNLGLALEQLLGAQAWGLGAYT